ncbi:DUF6188 family protein [Actinacidiphila soli]|uniref:DUF6188 family protein n=1 Tax=Actinacidiphila soli TaxID=2487275 RepID=UPI0013E36D0F|nr:DUF6188 family protein [Actinacidiphila soli]
MRTETDPVEHEDRWILSPRLRGLRVTRISIDFMLTLTLDSDWEVILEAPARLARVADGTIPRLLLTPETQDVAAALPLFGKAILSAVAFKSGALRLVFDGGIELTCSSDPTSEAWQITGPRGWRFVSLPAGGLAVWSGSGASEIAPGESETPRVTSSATDPCRQLT